MTTPDQLAEWARLTEAATPGPWTWVFHRTGDGHEWAVLDPQNRALAYNYDGWIPDAAFIAAARTAMPALLAANEELRRLLDGLRELAVRWEAHGTAVHPDALHEFRAALAAAEQETER